MLELGSRIGKWRWDIIPQKEYPGGVAGPFFKSMCLGGEHNIRRDCIGGGYSRYSTSGLLLTLLILRIIINLIMEFDDGN